MNDSGSIRSDSSPNSGVVSGVHLPTDSDGGIELSKLRAGTILEVQTRNNVYTVIPQASGDALVWGHPEYCPEPTLIAGLGGAYVSGYFRSGYLCPGMRLSFPVDGRRVSTSRIVAIQSKRKN